MGDTLHKMQVIIEASTSPLKKEMENGRKEVKKSVDSIQKETERIKNPFRGMESKALQPVKNAMNKIKEILGKNPVKNFQIKAGIKIPTEEYQQLSATIQKTQAKLEKYYERRGKMEDLGVKKESMSWRSLAYDIEAAERKLKMYEADKKMMENSNTDVRRPVSLPKQAMNFGSGILKGIGNIGTGISTAISKGWGGLTKLIGGARKGVSLFTGTICKCSGAFSALIHKFIFGIPFLNRTKSSFNGLGTSGRGLTKILKTVGTTAKFMFARFVIRGAVDGAKQGMQNLVQYSGETNRSLSLLMSSLTQLKNSLATAFAPILNVVAPILNSFIQMVINVVNSIGQLMGALTGKTTMVTAKKVNQDYAASLSNTSQGLKDNAKSSNTAADAAKNYQRTLLGFDQITKLDDNSDSSGNTGSKAGDSGQKNNTGLTPNDMFETTTVKSKFKSLANLIKDSWKAADFTKLGSMVGEKINKALESIPWSRIRKTCNKIAKSIATFLNGFLEKVNWGLVGKTLAKGLNTVFGFANTFAKNFHWKSLGKAVGNGINGALGGLDWKLIRNTVKNVTKGITDAVNSFISTTDWKLVGRTFGNCINTIFDFAYTAVHNFNWGGVGKALADFVSSAIKSINAKAIGKTISDAIKGLLTFFISAVEGMDWRSLGNTIYTKAKDTLTNIDWNGIADKTFEALGAAFGGLAALIGSIFKDAIADIKKYIIANFTEAGKFTWEGFKNGVLQSFKDVKNWIKKHIFNPFIKGFKAAFGIHSPSTVMKEQGKFVITGLYNGMKENFPSVLTWISKMPKLIKEKLGNAKTWLQGKGKDAITGLKNGWEAVKESAFLSRVKELKNETYRSIGDIKTKLITKGKDAVRGLKSGWDEIKGSAFLSHVKKIRSEVFTAIGDVKTKVTSKGKDAINGLKNGWEAVKHSSFLSRVKSIRSETYDAIGDIRTKVTSKGKEVISGMKSGLNDNWYYLSNALSSIPGKISNAIPNLYDVGRNIIQNFANGFSSINIPLPHIGWNWNNRITLGKLSFSLPSFNVRWYANGGFPDMGEMFVARESGPELVGRMGRKSAVANNDQIISGIRAGVFEAVVSAFESMQGNSDRSTEMHIHLEGDAKNLFKLVRVEGNNYQKMTGKPVFE